MEAREGLEEARTFGSTSTLLSEVVGGVDKWRTSSRLVLGKAALSKDSARTFSVILG